MKVVCAWCLEEGKPALVREKEPLDDPDETHGVCPDHKAWLKAPDKRPSVLEPNPAGGGSIGAARES